nr:AAA domain-containing protein [Limimaricola cinnabarinus]
MSPLSVAQYLPAGQPAFDVVIFDEASQITTWDAIGAIARGRQAIVVGDPKQLPPTNFFGRSEEDDEEEEDGFALRDMPSILDEVAASGVPVRRLDWHYRSRDEALIAFSNHFYYDGGLVTFPSPGTGRKAITLHRVDGRYGRGKGRTNIEEARAVVALIRERLMAALAQPEPARHSIGVITFNGDQQALILDQLDAMRRETPELEWFFDEARDEPLIVKNLENIQGDERDVMLFSVTFGPDLAGKLSMNFGALNAEGGERRLNVAITRARRELHVFASLGADQIDLGRSRARGVADLKAFLDYADRGAVALPARDTGSLGPAENPFEEAVARALEAKGWEVRCQIGVSGYRIDLAVVHPDRGGAYLAGVECDGASYHSAATARDRDRVRQAVLEGLGWRIERVWSTDWFRAPAHVAERLDNRLREVLAVDRARRETARPRRLSLPAPGE